MDYSHPEGVRIRRRRAPMVMSPAAVAGREADQRACARAGVEDAGVEGAQLGVIESELGAPKPCEATQYTARQADRDARVGELTIAQRKPRQRPRRHAASRPCSGAPASARPFSWGGAVSVGAVAEALRSTGSTCAGGSADDEPNARGRRARQISKDAAGRSPIVRCRRPELRRDHLQRSLWVHLRGVPTPFLRANRRRLTSSPRSL